MHNMNEKPPMHFLAKAVIPLFIIFLLSTQLSIAQWVYRTPHGQRYHTASCRSVKNVSEKMNAGAAVQLGLTPCKICKPVMAPQRMQQKFVAGESKRTKQCNGYTKKGTRCKHMTSIGNGYCHQHQ